MHNPVIQISESYDGNKYDVNANVGTFKEVKNYNRMLNTAEFNAYTKNYTSFELENVFKEGNFVWIDGEMKYIIEKLKKVSVGHDKWTIQLSLISLVYMLQTSYLTNKSVTQPIYTGSTLKTVKGEIDKLLFIAFRQFRGYTNYVNLYPNTVDVADEFIWTEPTLYEAISDLVESYNYIPNVTFNNTTNQFEISFVNITETVGMFDDSEINKLEVNSDIVNSPRRMINNIQNNISNGTILERIVYPKTDIGIVDDTDDQVFIPTTGNINKFIKVYAEATLGDYTYSIGGDKFGGHNAGFYKIDITDYILEKEVFNSLPVNDGDLTYIIQGGLYDARDYKNTFLYYEKDKKNIHGMKLNYRGIFGQVKNYNLNILLSYIGVRDSTKIIESTGYPSPSGQGHFAPGYYFSKNDVDKFTFTIEYQTMDSVRYDIEKSSGFGTINQNQGNAFINFKPYIKQQQDIMNKLGEDETVIMGYTSNHSKLPVVGNQWKDDLMIVQTTYVPNHRYVEFMAIATSKNNRIDSDSVINTKKRFTSLIPAEESIERHEYHRVVVSSTNFEIIKNRERVDGVLVCFLRLSSSSAPSTLFNYLVQEIDEKKMLITARTEDNIFAGLKIVDEDSTRSIVGVPYVDSISGEAEIIDVEFGEMTIDESNMKSFPEQTRFFAVVPQTFFQIRYKDNRERLAISILVERI